MQVTYYGHSCFGVKIGGKDLLFDPYITKNELAKGIDLAKVPADYVFISHAHHDHLEDAEAIVKRTGATIISNYEITVWFKKKGLEKSHPLNLGGSHQFDFGTVKFVVAHHSSSFPDGTYGGNPGGFLVESSEGNFYYSGDTAVTLDMKLIGESTKLRFAALCIGDNFTMGIDDAIKAAQFVKCSEIMGLHFDTFPPIRINKAQAVEKFSSAGLNLRLLAPGEKLEV
jgi:L-ascorbate metabolism protein UlaG (beta-lactamase superfamily)